MWLDKMGEIVQPLTFSTLVDLIDIQTEVPTAQHKMVQNNEHHVKCLSLCCHFLSQNVGHAVYCLGICYPPSFLVEGMFLKKNLYRGFGLRISVRNFLFIYQFFAKFRIY